MLLNEKPQPSKLIASLLGPVFVAVTISETINLSIWETSLPPVVYLNGMVFFAVGVAILRFHNLWRRNWTITITLFGWILVLAGLFRLFFPTAQQADASPVTYVFIAGLCLMGLFWSYKGYR
ncbi:MAG: hypothetical protein AAF125_20515 [Chloroflexota bacterium]